jgi:hypothetical protein
MKVFGESCAMSKSHRDPSKILMRRATKPLEIVHIDINGPMSEKLHDGSRSFILLIGNYTRFTAVKFLKRKSEALETFKGFKNEVEKSQDGMKIEILRSDNIPRTPLLISLRLTILAMSLQHLNT